MRVLLLIVLIAASICSVQAAYDEPEMLSFSHTLTFGTRGSGNGQLNYPACVSIDAYANLYITDWNNNRVVKTNSEGEFISSFSATPGTSRPTLKDPIGIAVSPRDEIIVVDYGNHRIVRFSLNGNVISDFGKLGAGNSEFRYPRGVWVTRDGNIHIADFDNYRIQTFSPEGEFISLFRCLLPGDSDGKLYQPRSLCVDSEGRYFVMLSEIDRVAVYDNSGKPLFTFGGAGEGPGQFGSPRYIDIDIFGRLYITDQKNSRVQIFNSDGRYLAHFDNAEKEDSRINHPEGLVLDRSGNIFVADANQHRILRFDAHPLLALRTWALRYDRAGLTDKAVAQYEKILSLKPDDAEALTRVTQNLKEKARQLASSGENEEAERYMNRL